MRRLVFFMLVSANGYYERGRWEIDWHHTDEEFNAFAIEQLDEAGTLVFGRVTYEGMASFWPTPQGIEGEPGTAKRMNALPKLVVSRTLQRADWNNTRIARSIDDVAALKREEGKDALVLASSDLAVSLAERGLIDEYRLLVNPIALPEGKAVFKGLRRDLPLKLVGSRVFGTGNVLLRYEPRRNYDHSPERPV
jgi:dihydrofolate reductase